MVKYLCKGHRGDCRNEFTAVRKGNPARMLRRPLHRAILREVSPG